MSINNRKMSDSESSSAAEKPDVFGGNAEARKAMARRVWIAARGGYVSLLMNMLKTPEGQAVIDDIVDGETVLSIAVYENHVKCVHVLLEAGADVDKADGDGRTALYWAAGLGNTDCAVALLDGGAEVDKSKNDGSTPLMIAVFNDFMDCVQLLIDRGANVNKVDNHGKSSLYRACVDMHRDVAALLLQRGARMDEDWAKFGQFGANAMRVRDERITKMGGSDAIHQQYEAWLATRPGRRTEPALRDAPPPAILSNFSCMFAALTGSQM